MSHLNCSCYLLDIFPSHNEVQSTFNFYHVAGWTPVFYAPSPCLTLCSVTCSPDLFSKENKIHIWAYMIQTDCNVYPVSFFGDSLDSLEPCAIAELWDCIAILLRLVIWHSHRKMLWKMDACCIFQMPSHPGVIPIHKVSERGLVMGLWHLSKFGTHWSCTWLWVPTWRIAHLALCHPDFNVHVQSHQTAPSAPHASRSVFCFDYLDLNMCLNL